MSVYNCFVLLCIHLCNRVVVHNIASVIFPLLQLLAVHIAEFNILPFSHFSTLQVTPLLSVPKHTLFVTHDGHNSV